jgi:cytochrome c oxidase assembly protein subunit 15
VTGFRRLLFFALFLTFDLIMFGAFVRITDAGLGCPDWPGCYGKATPLGAMEAIRAEAAVRPDGPVTVFKAWVEMLHRYVAAGLGLIVIALAVMATRVARRGAPAGGPTPALTPPVPGTVRVDGMAPHVALAWFTLFWIVLQGIFGAWTVTLKLKPLVVTAHLLGGMILFALLLAQAVRVAGHPPVGLAAARLRGWIAAGLTLLFVQIALGGWVSTNYATLACLDFPSCLGVWWPPMDFAAGFEPWRRLGVTGDGDALPFQALTAIHVTHRLGAIVVFGVLATIAIRARGIHGLGRIADGLFAVLLLQWATGLTNVFMGWPLAAAVLHTGGAAALLGLLLVLHFRARAAAEPPSGVVRDGPRRGGAAAAAGV